MLRNILRNEWNFKGVTISDHSAIKELINHGIARDEKEAAQKALEAGCDIDMMTACYANNLSRLVKEKKLDISYINDAAFRVLELKNDLGLFENPYRGADEDDEKKYILAPEFRSKAREAVEKSCVLLENNGILPLNSNKKIALIGPYGNSKELCGMWSFTVDKDNVITVKEGIEKYSNNVQYCTGSQILDDYQVVKELNSLFGQEFKNQELVDESLELKCAKEYAKDADVVIMALGEHSYQSGEAASRTDLSIPKTTNESI